MQELYHIDKKLREKILSFLYRDELMNVFLIHQFENKPSILIYGMVDDTKSTQNYSNRIFIEYLKNNIVCIIYIKYDGNSNLFAFYAQNNYLASVALLIKTLNVDNLLLMGKAELVAVVLDELTIGQKTDLDIYYKLNPDKYSYPQHNSKILLKKALSNCIDIQTVAKFRIGFFEAESAEEKNAVANNRIIIEQIQNGVYFLVINKTIVGMARFSSQSKNFIDITTVYIDQKYRGKGYGSILMKLMVKKALEIKKIPIVQASYTNNARHIYESIGFEKVCDYAFHFIDNRK